MATASKQIGAGDIILPVRDSIVEGIALCAAAATSTLEVFDGALGVVDAAGDISIAAAGTGYEVGDQITIASPATGGTPIIIEAATVDTGGELLTFTLVQAGTGFVADTGVASTGGTGSGATFDIDTPDDTQAVSIGKLSCVANTSDASHPCVHTNKGISMRVTGASAKGYLYYK